MSGWFGVGGSGSAGRRSWCGPVVCWLPFVDLRHAVSGQRYPRVGEQREVLCGARIVVGDGIDAEWLLPTCPVCWSVATASC